MTERTKALLALADACAAETNPEMQAKRLYEAWEALAEHSAAFRRFACAPDDNFDTNAGRFSAALHARAFESASMMLVPPYQSFKLERNAPGTWWCVIYTHDAFAGHNPEPALAIAMSALKAASNEVEP